MTQEVWLGDCLELMKNVPDNSIDLVLADQPYQTTQCKWDIMIPFEPMWEEVNRIAKLDAAIVLFGSEPFSSLLRVSNLENYKYDWVWQKDKATNHLNAKRQPMRRNELISVFYRNQCLYNPQLTPKPKENIRPPTTKRKQAENYGAMTKESVRQIPVDMSYPNETLMFRGCFGDKGKSFHPTQKPVDLLEYLIKTYTNEGGLVLDFCAGSGSTLVAAKNLGRQYIGIEKEKPYYDICLERLKGTV